MLQCNGGERFGTSVLKNAVSQQKMVVHISSTCHPPGLFRELKRSLADTRVPKPEALHGRFSVSVWAEGCAAASRMQSAIVACKFRALVCALLCALLSSPLANFGPLSKLQHQQETVRKVYTSYPVSFKFYLKWSNFYSSFQKENII